MQQNELETNLDQTIDQFWDTVPRVWNIIRGHVRTIAAEQFDISVEQFHLLRHIRKGFTSVKDIAEARQISRPAISQAAETLVEKGLITRRQEVQDRRYVHLALTPQGDELLNQIFQQNRAWMKEQMAALSTDEIEAINSGLQRLKAVFDEPAV